MGEEIEFGAASGYTVYFGVREDGGDPMAAKQAQLSTEGLGGSELEVKPVCLTGMKNECEIVRL